MRLAELLECLDGCLTADGAVKETEINGIQMDSRKIIPGNIFVAITGFNMNGHRFIKDAIVNGAAAVIGEEDLKLEVPYFRVTDSRLALGKLASAFYHYPSRKRKVIGITGTNGKTTVSYMLKHILESAGKTVSLFGTVSYVVNKEVYKPTNTTPDALQLQGLLAQSMDEYAILEVSSHALVQSRAEGLEIDYGLFTNLSHDHLDYHQTMEKYFKVKTQMFNYLKPEGKAIVSEISDWGCRMSEELARRKIPSLTLSDSKRTDLSIDRIKLNGITQFTVTIKGEKFKVDLPCPGLHNVYNAALAFLTAYDIGINPGQIVRALEEFPGVPGRFEMISHPNGATFIIDYAHTRDAIEYCLHTAKQHHARQITHIYGFRGGRDASKREDMVKASSSLCDQFILTLDDLNGVPEEEMIEEMHALNSRYGYQKGLVITDRTAAIQFAWENARNGDWVFITGKGPEEYKTDFILPVSSDKEALLYLQETCAEEQVV